MSRYQWWNRRQSNSTRHSRHLANNIGIAETLDIPVSTATVMTAYDIDHSTLNIDVSAQNALIPGGIMISDAVRLLEDRVVTLETSPAANVYNLNAALDNLGMEGYNSVELTDALREIMNMQRNGDIHALDEAVNRVRAFSNGTI